MNQHELEALIARYEEKARQALADFTTTSARLRAARVERSRQRAPLADGRIKGLVAKRKHHNDDYKAFRRVIMDARKSLKDLMGVVKPTKLAISDVLGTPEEEARWRQILADHALRREARAMKRGGGRRTEPPRSAD